MPARPVWPRVQQSEEPNTWVRFTIVVAIWNARAARPRGSAYFAARWRQGSGQGSGGQSGVAPTAPQKCYRRWQQTRWWAIIRFPISRTGSGGAWRRWKSSIGGRRRWPSGSPGQHASWPGRPAPWPGSLTTALMEAMSPLIDQSRESRERSLLALLTVTSMGARPSARGPPAP